MKMMIRIAAFFPLAFLIGCKKDMIHIQPCVEANKIQISFKTLDDATNKPLPNREFAVQRTAIFGTSEEFMTGKTGPDGKATLDIENDSVFYKVYFKSDSSFMTKDWQFVDFCASSSTELDIKYVKPVKMTLTFTNNQPALLNLVRILSISKSPGMALGFEKQWYIFSPSNVYDNSLLYSIDVNESRSLVVDVYPGDDIYIVATIDGTNMKVEKTIVAANKGFNSTIGF